MHRPLVITALCLGTLATAVAASTLLPGLPLHDAVNDRVFKEKERSYPTAADAPQKGDLAFVLPRWIPQDAREVRVKVKTTGSAKLIRFSLGATKLGSDTCGHNRPSVGAPRLDAPWWPSDVPEDKAVPRCSDYYLYGVEQRGEEVFAWTNGGVSPQGPERSNESAAPPPAVSTRKRGGSPSAQCRSRTPRQPGGPCRVGGVTATVIRTAA
ncbi:hypothetical protein ACIQV3_39295 [Streptomyces sp. NPDC099050]|uniref:hypothetical protein n=1 Tax=Streptomyces sp. NPDC099050 TaxID=3366100 RepID=UPI00382435D6